MKKILLISLAVMLISGIILTGCSGKTTPTTTPGKTTTPVVTTTPVKTTTPASTVKKGGTLIMMGSWSPTSMPGWPGDTTNSQRSWAFWIVFEGMVKIDANGQPIAWLATDWKFGPQNAYIDFNLRKDVKFTDGTNFTAESVVTHVNQLFTDKDMAVKYWDRIEKTGDYSVRIYITQYRNDFWTSQVGAWTMLITSDTQLKEKGLDYVKTHPVGTGPFTIQSFEKDVALKFVKNPNYWQTGKPYLDAITLNIVKETLTEQAQLQTKESDVMCMMSDGKVLKDEADKGMVIKNVVNQSWYLQFDTANEGAPTNDPKVRQAIEYALNKEEMADVLGMGYMYPANQLAGPDASSFAYNPNLATRGYDVEKAKQLLKEAGYENGFTLNLIADIANSTIQGTAVMVENYLKAVGITVTIEVVDNAKMWNYLRTGWHGGFVICFGMYSDLATLLSNTFPPWNTINPSILFPQDFIEKVNAAMVEVDQTKFKTLNYELSQWLWDNAYFIPTSAFGNAYVYQPYVKDSDYLKFYEWPIWSPENCWLDR
jgi:peptide/nickel transport system substrate-binding protein